MRFPPLLLTAALAILAGCDRPSDTPPEIERAYAVLTSRLNSGEPGQAVAQIKQFARQHAREPIARQAERDITYWQPQLDEAYLKARNLAREGQFERAEVMLRDLAQAPEERSGKAAADFLALEFHHLRAADLMRRGDTAAAEAIARDLRKNQTLNESQQAANERLLDEIAGLRMATTAFQVPALQNAGRTLIAHLESKYRDNGMFPKTLDLNDPGLAAVRQTGQFASIGHIEGYAATQDKFSFTLVGKDAAQKVKVTEKGVQ